MEPFYFNLPLEIIREIAIDVPTTINVLVEGIEYKREDVVELMLEHLSQFDPSLILTYVTKFRNEEGGFDYEILDDIVNGILDEMTLLKKILSLFESGDSIGGFLLYRKFKAKTRNIIFKQHHKDIFLGAIKVKDWSYVKNYMMNAKHFLDGYNIIKTLPIDQQREVRTALKDNLMMNFIFESENTNLDDWTNDLITNWIENTLTGPIIYGAPPYQRTIGPLSKIHFVRGILYYVHGDPRFDTYKDRRKILEYVGRLPPSFESTNPFDQILKWRGSQEGFESLFLAFLRRHYNEPNMSIEQILSRYQDMFPLDFGFVLAQYPILLDRYEIHYNDHFKRYEYTYDLFSYERQIPTIYLALQHMMPGEEDIEYWRFMVEDLGIDENLNTPRLQLSDYRI